MDGGRMQGSSMTFREVLTTKITELKGVNEKKRGFQQEINGINAELDALETDKRTLMKGLKQDFNSEEQIKEAIKQLEYKRMNTQFKSCTDENKIIKEMKTLQESIPDAHKLSGIKP